MQQQILLVLSFLAFVFMIVLRLWKKPSKGRHDSSNLKPPPGPWKLPIVGNIHQLVGSDPLHRRITDMAKKYGPIMQLQIGEVPTVIISSPDAAKQVLKTQELSFVDRPELLVTRTLFYNGKDVAFAPYGDYWRQMRKFCVLEVFSARRVRSFRSIREEEVSNFIRSIRSKAGSPVNLSRMFLELSIGIIARISVGKKLKNQDSILPIAEQIIKAVGGVNIVDLFPSSRLLYMISKERSRLERMRQEADQILDDIINERRSASTADQKTTGHDINIEAKDDLLDVLLSDHKNIELTTDSIKAIILDMFSGGIDTPSTLLGWTMSELMKNPSAMERAQKEVRQVFDNIENVDETSVDKLNFLKLVIKEALRLHPPGAFIPRASSKSCQINGYTIEAKSKVLINAWAIGRDPNYWNEAEKFYPERFLDCSVDYKGTNFELIPFGSGRRICVGMLLGMANVEFPLAQLLYHFDWKLPNGATSEDLDMQEDFGGAVKRKHNLTLIPISYCPSSVEH